MEFSAFIVGNCFLTAFLLRIKRVHLKSYILYQVGYTILYVLYQVGLHKVLTNKLQRVCVILNKTEFEVTF